MSAIGMAQRINNRHAPRKAGHPAFRIREMNCDTTRVLDTKVLNRPLQPAIGRRWTRRPGGGRWQLLFEEAAI
jgi:hypothetical protein